MKVGDRVTVSDPVHGAGTVVNARPGFVAVRMDEMTDHGRTLVFVGNELVNVTKEGMLDA